MLSSRLMRAPSARSRQPPPERSRSSTASPSCCGWHSPPGAGGSATRRAAASAPPTTSSPRRSSPFRRGRAAGGAPRRRACASRHGWPPAIARHWLPGVAPPPVRPPAEALRLQLAMSGIGDHQGGMGSGGAQRIAPLGVCRRRSAAVHDHPVAADRHLEAQRAGMGEAVGAARQAGGGTPQSDDQHACGRPADGGSRSPPAARTARVRRARPWVSTMSTRRRSPPAAVELRQPAIAVAQQPQRRRHPLDRTGKGRRRVHLRALQQGADLGQVLQRGKLRGRAAFDMPAIRAEPAGRSPAAGSAAPASEPGLLRQRHGGGDRALQRGQRARDAAPRPAVPPTRLRASWASRISRWRNASSAVAAKKS